MAIILFEDWRPKKYPFFIEDKSNN